jgi:hypothetical protein
MIFLSEQHSQVAWFHWGPLPFRAWHLQLKTCESRGREQRDEGGDEKASRVGGFVGYGHLWCW